MGIITRYFGPGNSGLGNGTTWADRAALIDAGNWNTIIRGHNFNGTDSLNCIIEAASYSTPAVALSFTSGNPSTANRLSWSAGTASGRWVPPNPGWNCCQPLWDTAGMVTLTGGTSMGSFRYMSLYGIRLHNTGSTYYLGSANFNWCELKNSYVSGSGYASYGHELTNCVLQMTTVSYSAGLYYDTDYLIDNIRIIGNLSASSGGRSGVLFGTHGKLKNMCIINNLLGLNPGAGTAILAAGYNCTFVNCTTGILDRCVATSQVAQYFKNLFHNCTTGISLTDVTKTRPIRDNVFNQVTTPTSGNANWDAAGLNTISSLDAADLFVDPANGDYRIKHGSPYWGLGIGAGDGPAPEIEPAVPASATGRRWNNIFNNV